LDALDAAPVCSQFVSGSERTSPLRGAVLSSSRLKVEFPNLRWSVAVSTIFSEMRMFSFFFSSCAQRCELLLAAQVVFVLCYIRIAACTKFLDARVRVVRVTGSSDAFLGA
jgi:hypothetical protein